ncbi:MAG: 50S ribosomal protein L10 [bacterium]
MPKTKQEKIEELEELRDVLKQAQAVVFTTFKQVPVKDIDALRKDLRQANISYQVIKRNLLVKALAEQGMDVPNLESWRDNIGIAVTSGDQVAPAKALFSFSKKFLEENKEKKPKGMVLEGGILDKKFLDSQQVIALALLPGREELLAKLVGSLASPMRGLAVVLQGNIRGLVQVLNAKAQQGS